MRGVRACAADRGALASCAVLLTAPWPCFCVSDVLCAVPGRLLLLGDHGCSGCLCGRILCQRRSDFVYGLFGRVLLPGWFCCDVGHADGFAVPTGACMFGVCVRVSGVLREGIPLTHPCTGILLRVWNGHPDAVHGWHVSRHGWCASERGLRYLSGWLLLSVGHLRVACFQHMPEGMSRRALRVCLTQRVCLCALV